MALALRSLAAEAAAEALRLEAASSRPGDVVEATALVRPALLRCALGAMEEALPADGEPAAAIAGPAAAATSVAVETADAASQTEDEEEAPGAAAKPDSPSVSTRTACTRTLHT